MNEKRFNPTTGVVEVRKTGLDGLIEGWQPEEKPDRGTQRVNRNTGVVEVRKTGLDGLIEGWQPERTDDRNSWGGGGSGTVAGGAEIIGQPILAVLCVVITFGAAWLALHTTQFSFVWWLSLVVFLGTAAYTVKIILVVWFFVMAVVMAVWLIVWLISYFLALPGNPNQRELSELPAGPSDIGAEMGKLGFAYEQGGGVRKDQTEAVRWYQKAAGAGNSWAMGKLGFAYEQGDGVRKDQTEAVRWYQKAAGAGNSWAMGKLGFAYEQGDGVRKDQTEAVRWYQKAAGQETAGQWVNSARV